MISRASGQQGGRPPADPAATPPERTGGRAGWRAWPPRRAAALIPALAGVVLGTLAIGPGLAPGFVLSYDMVFVPDPPLNRATFGLTGTLPRAVPSDAVVDVLSRAVPAEIVQKLVLLSIFVLACSGAAAVLRGRPLPARLAAGVLFAWNPFVAERLLIGQWALLLGYCGLPWLVVAFREQRYRRLLVRLGCALIPAAIGGFSAMLISALVIIPVTLGARRSGRHPLTRAGGVAGVLGLITALSLPWLIPSLLRQVHTDPAGAGAFAARADTPFGSLGSLLALGGAWNAQVVPPGYAGVATAFPLLLALAGMAGFAVGCRREPWRGEPWRREPCRREPLSDSHPDAGAGPGTPRGPARVLPGDEKYPSWRGLGAAAVIGLAIASIGLTPAGRAVLRSLIAAWPGFAVLRDGQQFVAPLALVDAIGLGAAVTWGIRPGKAAASGDRGRPAPGGPAKVLLPALRAGGRGARQSGHRSERQRARSGALPDSEGAGKRSTAKSACNGNARNGNARGRGAEQRLIRRAPGYTILRGAPPIALGVFGVLAPVLLLPGLAWGAGGRLGAVRYPVSWLAARQAIDSDRAPGSVLVLPWAAYRRYRWNDGRTMLDPWPRLLQRQTIWNDAVQVGNLELAPEDPEARRLSPLIYSGAPLTGPLRSAGVRYVIIDSGPGRTAHGPGGPAAGPGQETGAGGAAVDTAELEARLRGAVQVRSGDGLAVYRLPGPPAGR